MNNISIVNGNSRSETSSLSPSDVTTDGATSHSAKPQSAGQAAGYSHSTKLPQDDSQVAGYRGEEEEREAVMEGQP